MPHLYYGYIQKTFGSLYCVRCHLKLNKEWPITTARNNCESLALHRTMHCLTPVSIMTSSGFETLCSLSLLNYSQPHKTKLVFTYTKTQTKQFTVTDIQLQHRQTLSFHICAYSILTVYTSCSDSKNFVLPNNKWKYTSKAPFPIKVLDSFSFL